MTPTEQMREAAAKVADGRFKGSRSASSYQEGWDDAAGVIAQMIRALPLPADPAPSTLTAWREAAAKVCESNAVYYVGSSPSALIPSSTGEPLGRLLASAIRALPLPTDLAPSECVVVPREPTEAMVEAMVDAFEKDEIAQFESDDPGPIRTRSCILATYRAMLAAYEERK